MSFGWALMYNMLIGIVVTIIAAYFYDKITSKKFGRKYVNEFTNDNKIELEVYSDAKFGHPKMYTFLTIVAMFMLWEIVIPVGTILAYQREKRAWMEQNGKLDD